MNFQDDGESNLGDEIVSTLESMGFDLDATHELQYYFYFPLKESAEKLASSLSEQGFSCTVDSAAGDSTESLCLAKHTVTVDCSMLSALGTQFKHSADELGGVFDGWERVPQPGDQLPPMLAVMGGFQLYQEGRYQEAIELFASILERASEVEEQVLPVLGLAHLKLGQFEEAIGPFEKMVTLEPDCVEHKLNVGVAYHGLGNYEKAASWFNDALTIDPSLPTTHYNLACAYARQDKKDVALSALAQAINGNPAFREQAAIDDDFSMLRNTSQFKELL